MGDDGDPSGKALGGIARAKALSPEERAEIARKGAMARWDNSIPKATHTGEIHIGELTIACAVLPDGTRVLSQRGVGKALGRRYGSVKANAERPAGGERLPYFLHASALIPFITNELLVVLQRPFEYRHTTGGGIAFGIEATALPAICDVWLKARDAGKLTKPQIEIAKRADMLVRGLARVGIVALVDEATGYQEVRDRLALQKILDKYLTEERAKWAKTFPDDFYKKLFRLKKWDFNPGSMRRPGVVGTYTNDIVYDRIAPGVLKKLQELNPVTETGWRKGKHHQHFSGDFGLPELTKHINNVMFLMDGAGDDWNLFKRLLGRAAPKQGDTIPLDLPETA
jgi:hypothetical protein